MPGTSATASSPATALEPRDDDGGGGIPAGIPPPPCGVELLRQAVRRLRATTIRPAPSATVRRPAPRTGSVSKPVQASVPVAWATVTALTRYRGLPDGSRPAETRWCAPGARLAGIVTALLNEP